MKTNWPTKKLGEVADVYGGGTPRRSNSSYWGNDIPWLTMEDVNNNFEVAGTAQHISNQGLQNSNAQLVPVGSVNLSCTASVGNVTINRIPLATNQQFNSFHPHQDLLPEFLAYELIFRKREIKTLGGMTTFSFISKTAISNFLVHVPPLSIQKQIVERLDKIGEARKLNDELIQKSDELFQSLLHKELDQVDSDWKIRNIGEVCKITGGGTPSREETKNFEGDIPWVTVKDLHVLEIEDTLEHINKEAIENSAANLVPVDTVLVATRVGLGKVAIARRPLTFNQDIKGLRVNDGVDADYLFCVILKNAGKIEKNGKGATVRGVTQEFLKSIKVPIPPLEIQKQIVAKLSAVQEYKKQLLEQKSKLKELFDSVLHKSMNGGLIN